MIQWCHKIQKKKKKKEKYDICQLHVHLLRLTLDSTSVMYTIINVFWIYFTIWQDGGRHTHTHTAGKVNVEDRGNLWHQTSEFYRWSRRRRRWNREKEVKAGGRGGEKSGGSMWAGRVPDLSTQSAAATALSAASSQRRTLSTQRGHATAGELVTAQVSCTSEKKNTTDTVSEETSSSKCSNTGVPKPRCEDR